MPHLPTSAVAETTDRAAVMAELRRLLPGGTQLRPTLSLGLAAIDCCLPGGGLDCGALHEIVPAPHGQPAALGFAALLAHRASGAPWRGKVHTCPQGGWIREGKIVFVLPAYGFREYGRLHGHGLRLLGLDPADVLLVETAHRRDTLWALEEALRSLAPAAVAGFIDQLDLKTSQRLHLAAIDSGLPLFLMRPAQELQSSAAATRWRVGTVPAARDRFGLVVRPRWHLQLERCRNGRPGAWVVEHDHVAHRFSLAAALADPARARGATAPAGPAGRQSHCA